MSRAGCLAGVAATLVFLATGCADDDETVQVPAPAPASTVVPARTPPHLEALDPPIWPPFGPASRIEAHCTDDDAISSIQAHFKLSATNSFEFLGGPEVVTTFHGVELGEGQGLLRIVCCDTTRTCAERQIQNFFVDLTPPEIEAERLVVSPLLDGFDGEIAIWARDAWVLGSIELAYAGKTLRHELPQVYPSTVGHAWDVSRFTFPAKSFPSGSGTATVTVRDAAGNMAKKQLALRIDDVAPSLTILSPASGMTVNGSSFVVKLEAADADNTAPPAIDLWVGGTRIAELAGPLAEISVDTTTLPSGPTEVRAVARDDAGNESTVATVTVNVP